AKIVLQRDGQIHEADKESAAGWKLKQPKELDGRNANVAVVDGILRELRGLTADKLVVEKPSDADLDKYGLKTPVVRATVTLRKDDKKTTEDWVYSFGKETDDKTGLYAKVSKSDLVFTVRPSVLATLRGELQDPT